MVKVRVASPAGNLLFYGQWEGDSIVDIIVPLDQLRICDSMKTTRMDSAKNATATEQVEPSTTASD